MKIMRTAAYTLHTVSIKTVSNVANGRGNVAEATRMRVQAVIDELDYRPNLAAQELRATPATAPTTDDV